ncbi:LOW QUALITY PROTEIN: Fanconi anemia group D2 protein [Drosophila nasuta]|uniref:LOW QUALITY PROTEIN: Fanconi anemia group D2 protein n=1 Tax=Drosophila nasuta TaxID=42062 RepID=UPI00295F0358|nr:LOW QUALITY PROTEIN: Fanconi anemia group D2 protein [Drosophila nasuta]
MYRKFKKRANPVNPKPLNPIDENATIKIPRLSTVDKADDAIESFSRESEENIPASQEQTQRFLSQHSIALAATLGRTQSSSRINCSRQPNTFFEMVLLNAGVQLDHDDTFVLSCDHIAIVAKIRDILVRSPKYPDNIETFKTGLNAALAPKSKLAQKLLSGCTIDTAGEEQAYQSQNSMFINFLMIDFLREPCLEVLFNKIEEIAKLDRVQTIPGCLPLLPLMLGQLRYLTLSHSDQIYSHIERIFNIGSDSTKMDVINNAEFVLDASKHDDFVDLLIINYASSKDLFHLSTVQMLSNLSLNARSQGKLRERILDFIKEDSSCSNVLLPHLIRLLLNSLNQDTDDIVRELVSTLREVFNWRYRAQGDNAVEMARPAANEKQSQLELFGFLQQGLRRSKRFYQMWQRIIAGLPAMEFRSFDFIMLLLLIHINEDNTLYIQNLLRRRIKLEHLTVEILDEVKEHYAHILELHISVLMHILHDFVREKNRIVSDFAKGSYSILFKLCNSIQKNILKKLLELTFDKSAQHVTTMSLILMRELQRKNSKHIQNCAMLLLPLLDRLSDLTLPQTRLAMDLLCHVAFPEPKLKECAPLQDQIEMMVKKQQINRTDYVQRQGIIGCVQLIDAVARIETQLLENDDLQTSVESITSLPDGRSKQAANLIMLTQSAIRNSPELLALFYDELASVLTVRYYNAESAYMLDNKFLIWLCELMTYRFQQSFVSEHQPNAIKGIQLEYQKNINELDETNVNTESEVLSIGINISELVLAPNSNACDSIFVLAPLFNLVSVLHNQRYQCSLEVINALLGCAIILPSFFDDANYMAVFDNYDEELQKQILNIYFHTVNWIRVTICAFASQKHDATRKRVLMRLGDLICIEQRLKILLTHAPVGFVPPPCQFLNNPKQTTAQQGVREKRQTGKQSKAILSESIKETEDNQQQFGNLSKVGDLTIKLGSCKPVKCKIDFESLYGSLERYRQLDVGIIVLLKEESFTLNHPLESEEVGTHLGLLELRFILTDLVNKLETVINGHQDVTDADSLRSHVAKPEHFMCDLQECLGEITMRLITLAEHIDEQLEKVNNVHSNLDLFKDKFNYVKTCFGLCIHLFALYFSWNEWTDKSQSQLLQSSLRNALPPAKRKSLKKPTQASLATQVFDYFLKYEKSVLSLGTAVQLQRLLRSLRKLGASGENAAKRAVQQGEEIRKLCTIMLKRKWYHYSGSLEKGAQCNIHLDELVKGFLKDSPYDRQKDILSDLNEECGLLNKKDTALDSFPNIKKANFPLLFRGLCEILIATLSGQCTADTAGDRFQLWESTIGLLNGLLNVVKKMEQPRNFGLFLKHSQLFLKLLLQHGLPVLETIVRDSPERLVTFLSELQNVTKFLHNLCCHSKSIKNTAIICYIPSLRETLETLVFRMKALLAANKCHAAFHISILDNKDLHGDAIRTPAGSFATETNSDEEIPADDDDVDETVLDDTMSISSSTRRSSLENRSSKSSSLSKTSSRSKCF